MYRGSNKSERWNHTLDKSPYINFPGNADFVLLVLAKSLEYFERRLDGVMGIETTLTQNFERPHLSHTTALPHSASIFMRHSNNDIPCFMSFFNILIRIDNLLQRKLSINY